MSLGQEPSAPEYAATLSDLAWFEIPCNTFGRRCLGRNAIFPFSSNPLPSMHAAREASPCTSGYGGHLLCYSYPKMWMHLAKHAVVARSGAPLVMPQVRGASAGDAQIISMIWVYLQRTAAFQFCAEVRFRRPTGRLFRTPLFGRKVREALGLAYGGLELHRVMSR